NKACEGALAQSFVIRPRHPLQSLLRLNIDVHRCGVQRKGVRAPTCIRCYVGAWPVDHDPCGEPVNTVSLDAQMSQSQLLEWVRDQNQLCRALDAEWGFLIHDRDYVGAISIARQLFTIASE